MIDLKENNINMKNSQTITIIKYARLLTKLKDGVTDAVNSGIFEQHTVYIRSN
jgi:hypothetical protein